jgi:hypothetical protein
MSSLKLKPDFEYHGSMNDSRLLYVHRKLERTDIYWVNNRNNRAEDIEAIFRIEGKVPEIWHPGTGIIEKASFIIGNKTTRIPLHLEPSDAIFIVFRGNAQKAFFTVPAKVEKQLTTVDGEWDLTFQKMRGAPARVKINELVSWANSTNDSVKYFSGTGTYTKTIDAPDEWFAAITGLWIDLGEVKNLAEVIVNGKSMGIVWKKPFTIDVTGALTKGKNTLEIRVTNLWVNRLIGDVQPGVTKKITYTTMPFYRANSPLLASGLLGPVRIITMINKE